jgi:CHAT domain-containing protein
VLPPPDQTPADLGPVVLGDGNLEDWASLTGAEATETAVRSALARARVAHIALPFRINGASPLFSTLLTAGERGEQATSGNDAAIEAREVMNMEIPANVVVLADGSAMSMRESADDAAIVQWAWQAAGVPSLVVPRGAVDQPAATELLTIFHARLRAGDSPAVALRAATAVLRKREATAPPFYWAGWLLIGGGR